MLANAPRGTGRRIVICDYNALLLSVTGVLRMSGYCVFQAHDSAAAKEICLTLPEIGLLILNTAPTYASTLDVIRAVRLAKPDFPILHIGTRRTVDTPDDIPMLSAPFSADQLLDAVDELFARRLEIHTVSRSPGSTMGSARAPAVAAPPPPAPSFYRA
jgi:DNA-binding response OmpR family regulator